MAHRILTADRSRLRISPRLHAVVPILLSSGLAGVFLFAGLIKLAQPRAMTVTLAHLFPLLAEDSWLLYGASCAIAVAEVVLGLWLVAGVRPRLAALAAGGMLVVFTGVLAWLAFDSDPHACGCFGGATLLASEHTGELTALLRNGLLLGLTAWLFHASATSPRQPSVPA